ncbi:MAG: S9 family peptidase [Phycisphaeraceae bacterium]|nr:S9 family peptidase [Phycisphaeraceae bacterium]
MVRLGVVLSVLGASSCLTRAAPPDVTLELIMRDPEWVARSPEGARWDLAGRHIYFSRTRAGSDLRDQFEVDLAGEIREVPLDEWYRLDPFRVEASPDGSMLAWADHGDLFLRRERGEIVQLTRTSESESSPGFLTDGRLVFRRGGATIVRDLLTGVEVEPFRVLAEDEPKERAARSDGYIDDQQERLFEYFDAQRERRDAQRDRSREANDADPTRGPEPFYLGREMEIAEASLSPDGAMVAVRLRERSGQTKQDTMPQYVTDSGYVETRSVRPKIGVADDRAERLVLLDLETRERHDIDLSTLPGIGDDVFAVVREENAAAGRETPAFKEGPRPVRIRSPLWRFDGKRLAIDVYSNDRKDRWIALVDLEDGALETVLHERNAAWINWQMTDVEWLPQGGTLWFTSEQAGWNNLYLFDPASGRTVNATPGNSEVSQVASTLDGGFLYFLSNAENPGRYDVYRVATRDPEMERITALGGVESFRLTRDGERLLMMASSPVRPPEIFWQDAEPGAKAVRLTETVSEEFASIDWTEPEFIDVLSLHAPSPIHSRLYRPAEGAPGAGPDGRPAVVFVHGAGYLQNSDERWSYYFREMMFHTLLTRRGYVVLDMDYRASAGYGRDWRTAIYRRMGTPELEDLSDGVRYLTMFEGVDPERIGVYGGSYGGFMTLMALFNAPDLFACGASLRPVTDWAHYNDGYTRNILNTPGLDPLAFERSSPIEFAAGLKHPLLICHGMQDDNVLYQDTVRLAQRLIELKKTGWVVASYPMEAHGFSEPTAWLDEYRRILALFEEHLEP